MVLPIRLRVVDFFQTETHRKTIDPKITAVMHVLMFLWGSLNRDVINGQPTHFVSCSVDERSFKILSLARIFRAI